ncbi:MAG: hypothetical protein IKL74_00135 [Clostridia bacterium]|nr:hypothetical protein [Clostridia bacterium]
MATYYIDLIEGKAENDGLSEKTPAKDIFSLGVKPGDTVLFKRGTFYRGNLDAVWGEKGNVITYGAYGKGKTPYSADQWTILPPIYGWKKRKMSGVM